MKGVGWMEERLCRDCDYYEEPCDGEHCKNCDKIYIFRWEPVEMEERTCDNCRHYEKWRDENPCRNCSNSYASMWKPAQEPAAQDADAGIQMKEIKLKKRPEMLAFPVPIYERTDSEIPEKVRISFTNGTSAIYVLHVDQPKPLVMESIRIIRKWRSEGYQYVPPRRRRSRK